jgi:transposase
MKLSEVEKNVIILLHQDGFSQRAIARMTRHHRRTVNKYITEWYKEEALRQIKEWNERNPVKIYTINMLGFWMITI